jgi:hypothetical protein
MKLSDYGLLIHTLDKLGIPYTEYTDKQFIDDESVKAGAILCVSIRDSVHVNFNKEYDCISTATDSAKSTVMRGKK